ncbi:MAG: NYN domain-containing protein [Desulfobacca sp.]|uniref:NYN domain-containing protein n=1 Tax=Desulfobacca sp. TaxID=2067990 RepID=UPI0040496E8F
MALHLIIDGYNVIRQTPVWQELDSFDLRWGREALLESLAHYRRAKKHPITVVFDGGASMEMAGHRDYYQGILILYSHHGETADEVIKRLAARERERSLVISSDREIMEHALRVGAAVMSAPEFTLRLQLAEGRGGHEDEPEAEHHDRGTKKKGPAHRAPKKLRRLHHRLKKI